MKVLIKCDLPENSWQKMLEPTHPYMIPYAGKPLIDFYVDYFFLCSVSDITIVVEHYNEDLFKYVNSRAKWGTTVNIELADEFSEDESYDIVCDKFFLFCYDKNYKERQSYIEELKSAFAENIVEIPMKLKGVDTAKLPPLVALNVASIKDYYEINMTLVRQFTDGLVMKGFGGDDKVFMGINDVVMYKAELYPPLVMDDNCLIEGACKVGESVIMGRLSLIDSRSVVKNTIIADHTYVAPNMEIDGKIVSRQNIIDPYTNQKEVMQNAIDMSESLPDMVLAFFGKILERVSALAILLCLLPFAPLFAVFGKPQKCRVEVPTLDGKTKKVSYYLRSKRLRDIYFFKLSQDKLSRLLAVVRGKINLVGDSVQVASNLKNLKFYGGNYHPGAFTYADSIGKKDVDWKVMDDLHFKNHKTLRTMLQVVLRSLISRLFGDQS